MSNSVEKLKQKALEMSGVDLGELSENEQEMLGIYANLFATYCIKNRDYGNSFDQTIDQNGLVSAHIRMTDKMNRFRQLANSKQFVKSESLIDTLLDLSNYAAMTARYVGKNKEVVYCKV